MRRFTAAIVIGPLMLICALPAAGQSPPATGATAQSTAGADSTADRDTYTRKARNDMQEWEKKLHDFGASAKASYETASQELADALARVRH